MHVLTRIKTDKKTARLSLQTIAAAAIVFTALFGPFFARVITEDPARQAKKDAETAPVTEITADVPAMRERLRNERVIIHAGGHVRTPDGSDYTYTNSMEALERCYEKGNRICELDFILSADGYLVCAHNGWDRWAMGMSFRGAADRADFLAEKMYGELETMDLDALITFLREHEDLYVVTDIKSNSVSNLKGCSVIRKRAPDLLDRFIIQIYHDEEFSRVRSLGFPYIIYTLYDADTDEREQDAILKVLRKCDLTALTLPRAMANDDAFNARIRDTGVPLFVHTINDVESMNALQDIGVQGFYTDNIHNTYIRNYLNNRAERDTDAAE
ncbi:MAG: hypothetical protein IJQ21_01285 [Lachnospiraceae bacterium]|nr:hypothetical protein [Lachnospiraceae bacterium]